MTSAVVCAADAMGWIADRLSKVSPGVRRSVVEWSGLAVAVWFALQVGLAGTQVKRRYEIRQPLGFVGTDLLRIEPRRTRMYQELVKAVDQADVLFTTAGFNSLFLWTGHQMPAPVLVAHDLRVLPSEDRRDIIAGLAEARNPIVILKKPLIGRQLPDIDLIQWITRSFEPYRTIGPFRLLRRPGSARQSATGDGGAVAP